MPKSHYLPQPYGELLTWLINFITYLEDSSVVSRLGLDTARIAALRSEIDAYHNACTLADSPNAGKADRLDRREKAKDIDSSVRHYVNVALRYNENLTDEDRVRLGLTVPDTDPTPEVDPNEFPEIETDTSVLRRVGCRFLNREHHVAKPLHVHGTELRSGFVPEGEKPSLTHLPNSSFSTRSSMTLEFTDEDRGRQLGLCARYENNVGKKGPFGPIVTVFIP
ncbi:MAG: hypothetical protein LBB90_02510 [Tannerella sp.]|jgi:hypothetical protein|nr:hypothetical protein [Tannerella sp.]